MNTPEPISPSGAPAFGPIWFIAGLAVASVFALSVRASPTWMWAPRSQWLLGVFAALAVTGFLSVQIAISLAGRQRATTAIRAGLWGATFFDGLAIGFIPELYGDASVRTGAAAAIMWGVSCLGLATIPIKQYAILVSYYERS